MSETTGERRGQPRIPIEMWVEETTGSERYFRRAGNLSRGGLRLEHTIPLPVGTMVNLTFTLPGDKTPVAISGEIVSACWAGRGASRCDQAMATVPMARTAKTKPTVFSI